MNPAISSADNVIESFIWRPSRYLVVRFMDGLHFCGLHPQIPTVQNFAPSPKLQSMRAEGYAKYDKLTWEGIAAANKRQRDCPN
ncbi:hypothetical protein [Bradyrhizobium sp. AZCC 1610]|uniref:hypothetical protein n=1 Tax=Bradyrhizobium sp. AZCC 1610 TaxID=3117020 RepID=UPI002FF42878